MRVMNWSDEQLAVALLVDACRWLDARGLSHGRSLESDLLEPARELLRRYRPAGDIATWPNRAVLMQEARARIRARQASAAVREDGDPPLVSTRDKASSS